MLLARDGLVCYGGLIGGVLAFYLQSRARKLPMSVRFDATARVRLSTAQAISILVVIAAVILGRHQPVAPAWTRMCSPPLRSSV